MPLGHRPPPRPRNVVQNRPATRRHRDWDDTLAIAFGAAEPQDLLAIVTRAHARIRIGMSDLYLSIFTKPLMRRLRVDAEADMGNPVDRDTCAEFPTPSNIARAVPAPPTGSATPPHAATGTPPAHARRTDPCPPLLPPFPPPRRRAGPQPMSRLTAGQPKGPALTPARTSAP